MPIKDFIFRQKYIYPNLFIFTLKYYFFFTMIIIIILASFKTSTDSLFTKHTRFYVSLFKYLINLWNILYYHIISNIFPIM